MKSLRTICPLALLLAAGIANGQVGNQFTYQGRLTDNGQPANGVYDLSFRLWPTENAIFPLGNTVALEDVQVTGGLFTVKLDFGPLFDGQAKWMSINVRPGAQTGSYTGLLPRQELTAVPHAATAAGLSLPMQDSGSSDLGLFSEALFKIEQLGTGHGILGSAANGGAGVYGRGGGTSPGVSGVQGATAGLVYGVYGETASVSGRAVFGHATASFGNQAVGVYGITEGVGAGSAAVRGLNNGGGSNATYGVWGSTTSTEGAGVHGQGKSGVYGLGTTGGWGSNGVLGVTNQSDGAGVHGVANTGSTAGGIWGESSQGWAGFFSGSVYVTGTLGANDKQFLIDNPENPANEYLTHGCVESDELKNIYDGVVTLDQSGAAAVTLPSWFDDLNGSFRYQLTCIGGHAPVYIASEISNNTFVIGGGSPGLKVSWQVTGVRIDPAGVAARFEVVRAKPAGEQGLFLAPAAWGLDNSMAMTRFANPNPRPTGNSGSIDLPAVQGR